MAVDRLDEAPGFNASAHSKALNTHLKKPPGNTDYSVFQQSTPDALPPFITWIRSKLRDKTNELVANVNTLSTNLSNLTVSSDTRLDKLEADVKALQEAPQSRPFP